MTGRMVAAAGALLFLSAACNKPSLATPAGTTILKTTFTPEQGGPPSALTGTAPTRHVSTIPVADGAAEVEVRLDVLQRPDGKYLHAVEVVATKSGGGTLTAEIPQGMSPVNRGTPEQVLASLTLMTTWNHATPMKTSLRQTSIQIAGDGTAIAR